MAEFYAYWILAGRITIDRVPKKLRDRVQAIVDEAQGSENSEN